MQSMTLNKNLDTPSWGLARIIRRSPPWDPVKPQFPITTFYDAVRDGTGVDLYLLDSGIDLAHSEMAGRATNVYEYFSSGGAGDNHGHGTSVASAAVGLTCGPARGALIWSFKIYAADGTTNGTAVEAGMAQVLSHYNGRSATDRPAVVLANFGGLLSFSTSIAPLIDAGMVVVAPALNSNSNVAVPAIYPALDTDVICVGGSNACDLPYYLGIRTDATGAEQFGTNWGPDIDIVAPAQSVYVARAAVLGGGYRIHSGNSYSAPITAGVVACMLEGHTRRTTRAQVQAVSAKLLANATTGKLRPDQGIAIGGATTKRLPDRLLYLNPTTVLETF